MRNFYRLTTGANVIPLMLALHRFEKSQGIWKADTYLRDYPQGPFGDVESVILRFPSRSGHEQEKAQAEKVEGFDQHESIDHPPFLLLPEARPLIFGLMAMVNGERLGRCIINKLRPGGTISVHTDSYDHASYWDRFHIVLQTQPGVLFSCGGESVHMQTGEVWWFDNSETHEVINNSSDDRIHLVVDIRTSK